MSVITILVIDANPRMYAVRPGDELLLRVPAGHQIGAALIMKPVSRGREVDYFVLTPDLLDNRASWVRVSASALDEVFIHAVTFAGPVDARVTLPDDTELSGVYELTEALGAYGPFVRLSFA